MNHVLHKKTEKPQYKNMIRAYAVGKLLKFGQTLLCDTQFYMGRGKSCKYHDITDSQMKPNTRHKTHSSRKLATLLLRIDTAICRVADMHSENAQVHKVDSLLLWR